MSSEAHPEYTPSINRISADMKDAEARATRGDAAGAALAANLLINDVFAAQFRFSQDPNYMKSLNEALVNQKLLPPGFELSGTTHTDHGNSLHMKDKQSGKSSGSARTKFSGSLPSSSGLTICFYMAGVTCKSVNFVPSL